VNADDERHGTTRGYKAHRRTPEAACEPCRTANRLQGTYDRNQARGPMRPERQCLVCSRRTTAQTQMCRPCSYRTITDIKPPTEDDALPPGVWVRRAGGIYHHMPDSPPGPELPPEPELPDIVVAARTCRDCGSKQARRYLCAECAVESTRQSKRESALRLQAERAAA
jgi:hypothetical protein